MKILKVGIVSFIVFFAVAFFVVKYGIEYLSKGILEDALKAQAVELRKTLPKTYPNGLTWVAVNAQGKTFQYFYELSNRLNELQKPELEIWKKVTKKVVVTSACKATEMLEDMGHGVVYKYVYSTKDKIPVLTFSIAEENCS